jgi:hypothetical protein
MRRMLAPELAACAAPPLTDADLAALERSIEACALTPRHKAPTLLRFLWDVAFAALVLPWTAAAWNSCRPHLPPWALMRPSA